MKLVIVEGLDRVGKNTLIDSISADYANVIKRHWSYPKGETNEEKTQYQKDTFRFEFDLYKEMNFRLQEDSLMIWNRSHIGELVWGSLYRNSQPETWVYELEQEYGLDKNLDVYLIYLWADPNFIVKEDDGNSYSAKLADKQKELDHFNLAVHCSEIKKKLVIKVNSDDHYISKEIIKRAVTNFINK